MRYSLRSINALSTSYVVDKMFRVLVHVLLVLIALIRTPGNLRIPQWCHYINEHTITNPVLIHCTKLRQFSGVTFTYLALELQDSNTHQYSLGTV